MMQAATRSPQYLADFEFERLFIEELGWDRHATELRLDVSRSAVTLNACQTTTRERRSRSRLPRAPLSI